MARETFLLALGLCSVIYTCTCSSADPNSTYCYSCHLAPGKNECTNANVLYNARQTFEDTLRSNDTNGLEKAKLKTADLITVCDTTMQFCVIERIIMGSEYKLMYRDCSDGIKFSTNVSGTRLEKLPKDNNTHCAYVKDILSMVCISVCRGNFCNGPADSAVPLTGLSSLHVLCSIVVLSLRAAAW